MYIYVYVYVHIKNRFLENFPIFIKIIPRIRFICLFYFRFLQFFQKFSLPEFSQKFSKKIGGDFHLLRNQAGQFSLFISSINFHSWRAVNKKYNLPPRITEPGHLRRHHKTSQLRPHRGSYAGSLLSACFSSSQRLVPLSIHSPLMLWFLRMAVVTMIKACLRVIMFVLTFHSLCLNELNSSQ